MVHNNLRTRVHNYPETLILIYSTHQSIIYGIMKSIHISIMSKLIIVNALVTRILWRHWHVVLIFLTFIKFLITQSTTTADGCTMSATTFSCTTTASTSDKVLRPRLPAKCSSPMWSWTPQDAPWEEDDPATSHAAFTVAAWERMSSKYDMVLRSRSANLPDS
jgi:hypothetical protein